VQSVIIDCCCTIAERQLTAFSCRANSYFAIRPVQRKMSLLLRRTQSFITANVHLSALFFQVPGSYWR
jgi:hypothetical protein